MTPNLNLIPKSSHWLIVTNHSHLTNDLFKVYSRYTVWALDGAASQCQQANFPMHVLSGDFDSIDPQSQPDIDFEQIQHQIIERTNQGLVVIHTPNQDKTDCEKALDLLAISQPTLTHVTITHHHHNPRPDHVLYHYNLLKTYQNISQSLSLVTQDHCIRLIENTVIQLTASKKSMISIFGYPRACIHSRGLAYELTGQTLAIDGLNSISNQFKQTEVKLQIIGQALIMAPLETTWLMMRKDNSATNRSNA